MFQFAAYRRSAMRPNANAVLSLQLFLVFGDVQQPVSRRSPLTASIKQILLEDFNKYSERSADALELLDRSDQQFNVQIESNETDSPRFTEPQTYLGSFSPAKLSRKFHETTEKVEATLNPVEVMATQSISANSTYNNDTIEKIRDRRKKFYRVW